jgi:Flp pilus assembly protein TadB
LFHDPMGKKLVMAGIVCLTLGNVCIRKIVKIRV